MITVNTGNLKQMLHSHDLITVINYIQARTTYSCERCHSKIMWSHRGEVYVCDSSKFFNMDRSL